jgi:hypothetical protein
MHFELPKQQMESRKENEAEQNVPALAVQVAKTANGKQEGE